MWGTEDAADLKREKEKKSICKKELCVINFLRLLQI